MARLSAVARVAAVAVALVPALVHAVLDVEEVVERKDVAEAEPWPEELAVLQAFPLPGTEILWAGTHRWDDGATTVGIHMVIDGPEDSPYEGHRFLVNIFKTTGIPARMEWFPEVGKSGMWIPVHAYDPWIYVNFANPIFHARTYYERGLQMFESPIDGGLLGILVKFRSFFTGTGKDSEKLAAELNAWKTASNVSGIDGPSTREINDWVQEHREEIKLRTDAQDWTEADIPDRQVRGLTEIGNRQFRGPALPVARINGFGLR